MPMTLSDYHGHVPYLLQAFSYMIFHTAVDKMSTAIGHLSVALQ